MSDLEEAGIRLVAEGQDAFEGVLAGVGNVVSGFGALVLDVASEVGEAFVEFFQDSFAGALEAEQTIARLGQVIESTGGIAGVTIGEAEDLADEFKHLAGGSDDAVLSIIDMGLRMGTISEEEMPAFIQTTLDLGTVMGDTAKASQVLARAQEDPIGTLGALRKAGILVSEELEAQMKAMVATGDTAGAYSLLMDRVGEATAGAAETMAATTAGQWAIFQETIADAGESIVGALLPALNSLMNSTLTPLLPIIQEVATAFGLFFEILMEGDIGGAFDALGEFDSLRVIFQGLGIDIYGVGSTVETFVESLPGLFEQGKAAMQPILDGVANVTSAFADSMPMIQGHVQVMVDFVIDQFNTLSPQLIANVSSTLDSIAMFWREHGDEIMLVITVAFEFISTTIGVALNIITGAISIALDIINGDWAGAWETYLNVLTSNLDAILSIVDMDLASFLDAWQGTFTLLGIIVQTGFENVVALVVDGLNAAIDAAMTIVSGVAEIGEAFITNIANGITDSIAGLVNAARDAAASAYQAILDELLMHSPSPLLMNVGMMIDESMALGMLRNIRAVVEAADSVGRAAIVRPPMSAGQIGAQYAYSTTDARQYNLYSTTDKRPSTVATEFATMQVLAGLT